MKRIGLIFSVVMLLAVSAGAQEKCNFEKVAERDEVAIHMVPFGLGFGGLHVDIEVGQTVWNNTRFLRPLGQGNNGRSKTNNLKLRERLARREVPMPANLFSSVGNFLKYYYARMDLKPYRRYALNVTPENRAKLDQWIADTVAAGTKHSMICSAGACAMLDAAGIHVPYRHRFTPALLNGYLRSLANRDTKIVKSVEDVGYVGPRLIVGSAMELAVGPFFLFNKWLRQTIKGE